MKFEIEIDDKIFNAIKHLNVEEHIDHVQTVRNVLESGFDDDEILDVLDEQGLTLEDCIDVRAQKEPKAYQRLIDKYWQELKNKPESEDIGSNVIIDV